MNFSRKNAIVSGVALLALILTVWCAVAINAKKDREIADGLPNIDDSVALSWVDSFTKRDFDACDLLVGDQNYRLYAPLVITHSKDRRYYSKALDGTVDCIRAVSLVSVEGDTYKVKISLVPYQPVGAFDVSSIPGVRSRFIEGMMSDVDFTNAVQDVYYDAFVGSCFVPSEEIVDIIAVLSEYELEGARYVSGTVDFVDLILQESGLSANFIAYESSVKSDVDAMLKSGFDE